jgi:Protein of unknown function (DUF433)
VFENLAAGADIEDIMEWYDGLKPEQVKAVLEFVARSYDAPEDREHALQKPAPVFGTGKGKLTPKFGTLRGKVKILDPDWARPMTDEEAEAWIEGVKGLTDLILDRVPARCG